MARKDCPSLPAKFRLSVLTLSPAGTRDKTNRAYSNPSHPPKADRRRDGWPGLSIPVRQFFINRLGPKSCERKASRARTTERGRDQRPPQERGQFSKLPLTSVSGSTDCRGAWEAGHGVEPTTRAQGPRVDTTTASPWGRRWIPPSSPGWQMDTICHPC